MDILEDGRGSGNKAGVTTENQLLVQSESLPSEGFQAQMGKGFIVHAECHTDAAASGGLLLIQNLDTIYDYEITRIYIDPHVITPTDLIITQAFEPSVSNGSDVSSTAIVQKNRNTAEDFNLMIKISDGSSNLTYTGGNQYHSFPAKSMTSVQRDMKGTNIVPANKAMVFGWKTAGGGNATDGEVVSFSVNLIKRARS